MVILTELMIGCLEHNEVSQLLFSNPGLVPWLAGYISEVEIKRH